MKVRLGYKNLFMLGLMAEKPRYGYELKKILMDRYGFYGVTVTTIYRALKMMQKSGWLEGCPTRKEWTEQHHYGITEKGLARLREEVEFYLGVGESALLKEFNTALRFRNVLDESRIRTALQRRRTALLAKIEGSIGFLEHLDEHPDGRESWDHMTEHYRSELAWLDKYFSKYDKPQPSAGLTCD